MIDTNRKRENVVRIRLSDSELQTLELICEKTGQTKSAVIRDLVTGCKIREQVDPRIFDFLSLMRETRNNLRKMNRRLGDGYDVERKRILEIADEIEEVLEKIREIAILP